MAQFGGLEATPFRTLVICWFLFSSLSLGVTFFCSFSSLVVVSFTRRAARRLEGVSGCGGLFIVGEGPSVVAVFK
jgi:hypothetical protein